MPESPTLPLLAATIPADVTACDLKSLQDWANFFVKYIFVDGASINSLNSSLIFVGPDEPTGENIGKIWIKTSNTADSPAGIGLYIGGHYIIIPIPSDSNPEIPINSVIPWQGGPESPPGWIIIDSSGAPGYGYDTSSLSPGVVFIKRQT